MHNFRMSLIDQCSIHKESFGPLSGCCWRQSESRFLPFRMQLPPYGLVTGHLLNASRKIIRKRLIDNDKKNRFERCDLRCVQSPHCAANCLQHTCSSDPGAIVCKLSATHRALITYVSCTTWYEGTAQLLRLTKLNSHFILAVFHGLKPLSNEGQWQVLTVVINFVISRLWVRTGITTSERGVSYKCFIPNQGAGIAQLVVLGLAVHSVAGSILLWGYFR